MKIKTSKCVSGKRKISDLLSEKWTVYIYLGDAETGDAFMKTQKKRVFCSATVFYLQKEILLILWLFAMTKQFVM